MPESPEYHSPWQQEVLRRLVHAIKQRKEQGNGVNKEGLKLLDEAIFNAFVECKEADLGEKAENLLEEAFGPREEREGRRKPHGGVPE